MKTVRSLFAIAVCALCISSAHAALLLDWQSGILGNGTPVTGVSGTSPITFVISKNGNVSQMDGLSITVTLTAATGYNITGLTTTFTLGALGGLTSITVGGQTFGASGGSLTTPISLANVSGGNSISETFTLSNAAGPNGPNSVTFTDIQFNGTVTPVPEPVTYAVALFGLVFVGGGVGRFYLGRRHKLEVGS